MNNNRLVTKQRIQVAVGLLLLTVIASIFTNIATDGAWGEYTWAAWMFLIICILGAIGLTARQFNLEVYGKPSSSTNRLRMLDKVENFWIKGLLDQSLYHIARIELGLSYEPDAITHPWDAIVQRPGHTDTPIPRGKSTISLFDELGGEMLILGAPGSGKTTLLMELLRDLILRARNNKNHLIPVVFNLSSWATRQRPLREWFIEELKERYDVSQQIAQDWVETNAILPLLDGLDEVAQDYRDNCVEAINSYHRENGLVPLAICSRTNEYKNLAKRLRLHGAVEIQPLKRYHVDQYLEIISKGSLG